MSTPASLRTAARRLLRRPGFTAFAIGLIGLGVGGVASTWTVLDRTVLRDLPVVEQDGLVVAWIDHQARGFDHFPVTVPLFEAVERADGASVAAVAAVSSSGAGRGIVEGVDGPWTVAWSRVLGDFFGVLGVEAARGRTLELADDVPAPAERVAVISDGLWRRRFGGSSDIIGTELRTRLGTYVIVGVMPADFDYPRGTEVWAPTRPAYPTWDAERPLLELDLVARLRPGTTATDARHELAATSLSTPDLAEVYEGSVPVVRSLESVILGDLRPTVVALFLGAVLVLLVAGLDLANVILLRAVAERREMAIRRAIGADPRRLVAEAVAEAGLLAAGGCLVGIGLGGIGLRLLLPLAPPGLPRLAEVGGLHFGAVALAITVSAATVFGAVVWPRWQALRGGAASALSGSVRHSPAVGEGRLREILVTGQVALAVWVLASGALLVRTASNLHGLDPGFSPEGLAVVQLNYEEGGVLAPEGSADRLRAAATRLARHPGVVGATPVQMGPLPGAGAWQTIVYKEGQTADEALAENAYLFMEFVEPVYFDLLSAPLLRGRSFGDEDIEGAARVVVVNDAAARLYWPNVEAVGQRISTGLPDVEGEPMTVVGVVGDTRYGALRELKPTVYFPLRQIDGFRSQHLLVRTTGAPPPLMDLAREALAAEAPGVRPMAVEAVADRLAAPLAGPRFSALLLGLLALTALAIALAGIYAVMAFMVEARRREIGVRLACGGTPTSVAARVVQRGLIIALIGATGGALAAAWTGRTFDSLLFGITGTDPASLAAAALAALGSAVLACLIPARRASRVDPAQVLRLD
ncbi:MAG: FtsX-like permease family protein [Gemmatimonadetes bacterium]|nr:FtsX-like permease family protein [Gemmatimonadota bacterium]